MQKGFNAHRYLEEQSKHILERVARHDKLYLEFGGKLLFDLHAKRVLPGFDENAKIKVLQHIKDQVEVVICVYAGDIERNKIRGDFGITYDMDVFRLIDDLRGHDILVNSVVITRYEDRPATSLFVTRLERRGIKVYKHLFTKGYPTDIDVIVSDEGYGKNSYIETSKPIVVVAAPGPWSWKLATCLSQLYHDTQKNINAGYAKFETFPVWNLPLNHPLNIAYEAATVDLEDINMIDPFHLEVYGEQATNYNRDIESFPLLMRILEKITGKAPEYQSPTDMGVNRVAFGIDDDEVIRKAASQEVIRRYFKMGCEYKKGYIDRDTFERAKLIMQNMGLKEEDRAVVVVAREKLSSLKQDDERTKGLSSVMALELPDGTIVTGKKSELMDASAAVLINAIKHLANIDDELLLISPLVLDPVVNLKINTFKDQRVSLDCEEVLMVFGISGAINPMVEFAFSKLGQLAGCQAHSTTILTRKDEQVFRKLGVDVSCDKMFPSENLYYH